MRIDGDYIANSGQIPRAEVIDVMIAVQCHRAPLLLPDIPHQYTGSDFALEEIGKRDLWALLAAFTRRLRINEKAPRIDAAHIIRKFAPRFPELALRMVEPLIESLELDDDHYEDSADAEACRTLAEIYRAHPDATQQKLAKAATLLEGHYARCMEVVIPELIRALNATATPLEGRRRAVESLSMLAQNHPHFVLPSLDSFFGSLAMLAHEEKQAADEKAGSGLTGELDRSAKIDGLSHVSNQLVKVINELCEVAPQEVLTRLHQIVPKLSSQQPQEEILKAQLISLYETLGQIDEIAPAIVPDLYRALMDFSSVKVRGTAIGAVANILRWNSQIIPENMRDVLISLSE
jgi:hypothetical protein